MMKVVQCWDDGVNDDIRLIEILRKYGAKASFNLAPSFYGAVRQGGYCTIWKKDIYRLARSELNDVYAGFTIANHSMTHLWPTRIPLDDWRHEVVDARKILQDWFQQPILGFVYPFGDCDLATANVVREAGHLYARAHKKSVPLGMEKDPMFFSSNCHFLDEGFWGSYAKAKASGAEFFYFYGHSFEVYTEEQWAEFEDKIARITQDPESEWAEIPDLFSVT